MSLLEFHGLRLLYILNHKPVILDAHKHADRYIAFWGKNKDDDQGCIKKLLQALNFDTNRLNRREKDKNGEISQLGQIGYICEYVTTAFSENKKSNFKVENIIDPIFMPICFSRQLTCDNIDIVKARLLRTAIIQWLDENQRLSLYYADLKFEAAERLIIHALDNLVVWTGVYANKVGTEKTSEYINEIANIIKNDIGQSSYILEKILPQKDSLFHIAMAISANKSVNATRLYVQSVSSIRRINKLIKVSVSRNKLYKQFCEIRDYSTPNSYEEIMQDYGDSIRKYFPNFSDDKIKQLWDIAVKLSVIIEWYKVDLSRNSVGEFAKSKIAMTRTPNKSWYQENKIQTEKLRLNNIIACMEILEQADIIRLKKVSRTNRYVLMDDGENGAAYENSRTKSLFDILMNYRRWTTPELDFMLGWWRGMIQVRRLCSSNCDTIFQSIIDSAEALCSFYANSLRGIGGSDQLADIDHTLNKLLYIIAKMKARIEIIATKVALR